MSVPKGVPSISMPSTENILAIVFFLKKKKKFPEEGDFVRGAVKNVQNAFLGKKKKSVLRHPPKNFDILPFATF